MKDLFRRLKEELVDDPPARWVTRVEAVAVRADLLPAVPASVTPKERDAITSLRDDLLRRAAAVRSPGGLPRFFAWLEGKSREVADLEAVAKYMEACLGVLRKLGEADELDHQRTMRGLDVRERVADIRVKEANAAEREAAVEAKLARGEEAEGGSWKAMGKRPASRAQAPNYESHFNLWLRACERLAGGRGPAWVIEEIESVCRAAYNERCSKPDKFRDEDLPALTVAFQERTESYRSQLARVSEKFGDRPDAIESAVTTAAKAYVREVKELFGVMQD